MALAVDKSLFVLFGFVWLGGILYAQHRYRQACGEGIGFLRLLLPRFLRVTLVELAILVVAVGIRLLVW